ncbi:hypothetical protein FRC11_014946 [Ceratobasidium sp. 423]|nr:hypothetical protein FRC11_014946 [Ceratobasidium sp. 423]
MRPCGRYPQVIIDSLPRTRASIGPIAAHRPLVRVHAHLLDWADHSVGIAKLAIVRYKATKQPKLGTLFLNPGGPGGSGVNFISSSSAETISEAAGGQYDIVSWDPRRVGHTVPRADCFKTRTEKKLSERGKLYRSTRPGRILRASGWVDVLLDELAYSPDTFRYIGTAAGVRDLVDMHDVLEGLANPLTTGGFPMMWGVKPESTDETFTGIRKQILDLIDAVYDHKREFGPKANYSSAALRAPVPNYGWWLEFTPALFGASIIAPSLIATGGAVGRQRAPDEFPEVWSYQAMSFKTIDGYIHASSPRYWLLWPGVLIMLVY